MLLCSLGNTFFLLPVSMPKSYKHRKKYHPAHWDNQMFAVWAKEAELHLTSGFTPYAAPQLSKTRLWNKKINLEIELQRKTTPVRLKQSQHLSQLCLTASLELPKAV